MVLPKRWNEKHLKNEIASLNQQLSRLGAIDDEARLCARAFLQELLRDKIRTLRNLRLDQRTVFFPTRTP